MLLPLVVGDSPFRFFRRRRLQLQNWADRRTVLVSSGAPVECACGLAPPVRTSRQKTRRPVLVRSGAPVVCAFRLALPVKISVPHLVTRCSAGGQSIRSPLRSLHSSQDLQPHGKN
eukprot:884215-Prorocentrum_minimum.AAC.3